MKFDKKLVNIIHDQDGLVIALFSDGSQETGNLLVGCDGSRSIVRNFLVGEELGKPTNIDLAMINHATGGYTAEQAVLLRKYHPIGKIAYHPDYHGNFLLTGTFIFRFCDISKLRQGKTSPRLLQPRETRRMEISNPTLLVGASLSR